MKTVVGAWGVVDGSVGWLMGVSGVVEREREREWDLDEVWNWNWNWTWAWHFFSAASVVRSFVPSFLRSFGSIRPDRGCGTLGCVVLCCLGSVLLVLE